MSARLLTAAALVIATLAPATAAELVIGLGAAVTSIDPHNNNAAPNNSIAEQIFNKLMRTMRARSRNRGWPNRGRRSTTSPGNSSCAAA